MSDEVQQSQETELEKERRIRAQHEYKTEKLRAEHRDLVESTKRDLFEAAFTRQLATVGIPFNGGVLELRDVMELKGTRFNIKTDGSFSLETRDGQPLEFATAVEQFAVAFPYMVADKSKIAHLTTAPEQMSRDMFTSTAQKASWIEKHSLAEWEALPATRQEVVTKQNLTRDIFNRATNRQKLQWNLSHDELSWLLHHGSLDGFRRK